MKDMLNKKPIKKTVLFLRPTLVVGPYGEDGKEIKVNVRRGDTVSLGASLADELVAMRKATFDLNLELSPAALEQGSGADDPNGAHQTGGQSTGATVNPPTP